MATVKTYDEKCYELACSFLEDVPKFDNEIFRKMLALEIQQVIEDEISFMEGGHYDANGNFRVRAAPQTAMREDR